MLYIYIPEEVINDYIEQGWEVKFFRYYNNGKMSFIASRRVD